MSHYATVVPVVTRSMLTAAQLLGSIERDVADLRASVRTTNSCRDDQQELVRLLSADNNVLKVVLVALYLVDSVTLFNHPC